MGDFIPPKKQQVVDRILKRLDRCRKQQELSLSRFDLTIDERRSQERQEKEVLYQRCHGQDNRNKRQPKGLNKQQQQQQQQQEGGQNKAKSEGIATTGGTAGGEGPMGRQQSLHKHAERKRPYPESTNGPDASNLGDAQANGFEDTAKKRPCTEISVQIVQKTGDQTDLKVTTTIQQSGDSATTIAEASNNNLRSQNGCKTAECPQVSQSNGQLQHQEWTEERRQVLEKLLDDPVGLEEFMKQLENDPEQMKSFEAELEKICNKLQHDLGDGTFPDGSNIDSQQTQEMNQSGEAMPMASAAPAPMPAVANLPDATKLTTKQGAPTMPVAPMLRTPPSFSTIPAPVDTNNLKQRIKTEMITPTTEQSDVYDPMMKGPPNTVATDAHSGKEGPLPAIAEFKNPAIFDATNIKIEPQAGGGMVESPNPLQAQFQSKQGQANLLNQKQTSPSVNQKNMAQMQSGYRNAPQQHVIPSPNAQLSHYTNQQQQQQQQQALQQQQQQQQQQGGITAAGSQFGMQMSRSLQSLQDQLKQRSHTLTGTMGGIQNPNAVVPRAQFTNRQGQITGRLPSMAQVFGQTRLNAQQVQQQQQQQPAAFPVDGGIQQVRQNMPGTQQQLPQQQQRALPQQQQQQQGQFVQQCSQLSPAGQQLLKQQMIQRQLLKQQQDHQLQSLTPEQRCLLIAKRRQLLAQQKQKELQLYQRGPPPRYDEAQHRNSTFANQPGLMQQAVNVSTNQLTGGIAAGTNALIAGNVRQGSPLQQTLQQGNIHHQGMRSNPSMIQTGQIGTTGGTQLSQGMYPNQAQAQFIQQRRQQLLQMAGNNMQIANQVNQQAAGTMLNQLGRSRLQGPNTAATLAAAGSVYMKQQVRGQTPVQITPHNTQGTNILAGNPAQSHQVSTVGRFPSNLVNTTTNVRTFMQNMPSQNMNLHSSMTTQATLQQQQQQQQQQQHSYGNQSTIATSSVMQPTNHSEPSIVTAMTSVATPTTHHGSFPASSSHLPMDLLDSNVNLGSNTMSNVEFDLELLENILKTKE